MNTNQSKLFATVGIIAGLVASFILGTFIGYQNSPEVDQISGLMNGTPIASATTSVDFEPFWRTWNLINQKFVADQASSTATSSRAALKKVGTPEQQKVWGAMGGLVASLGDPYSVFFPPVERAQFEEDISGNFGGLGIEIGIKEGILTVIAPMPDSPAKRAGVLSGDKIIKINDTPTLGLSTEEAVNMIRGKVGTQIRLTFSRGSDNKIWEAELTRDLIKIPTVDGKIVSDYKNAQGAKQAVPQGVFVISLYNFSAPSSTLFRDKLREFILSGSDKLIIDLRGNPGGYLEAAVDMSSWFLDKGKVVVRESYGPGKTEKLYRSRGYDIFNDKLKVVILVDRGSASASEIFAGALSEYGIATLVGEKTFGKGSVQELIPISDGSALKLTIARWLTPQGRSISHNGLEPDVKVARTEEDIKAGRDPQLDKAIEILSKKN